MAARPPSRPAPQHRVLVPPTDRHQFPTTRKTFDDLQGRCNVAQCWHRDNDSIRLVPVGGGQPIPERKVWPQVDDCQSLPACRSGKGENPQLVATSRR